MFYYAQQLEICQYYLLLLGAPYILLSEGQEAYGADANNE